MKLLAVGCAVALLVPSASLACRESRPLGRREPLAAPPAPPASVKSVPVGELCLTSGRLRALSERRWLSESPTLRATASNSAGRHAAVVFRYLGDTAERRRLGSGALRRQVGLELLSRDTYNVVYAAWRFWEPRSVAASIKSNPGLARHGQCGHRGYRVLEPLWRAPVSDPRVGSVHELSATIARGLLELRIDGRPVLRAALEGEATPAFGSSGLRSDNVRLELLRFDADLTSASAACAR